MRTSGAAGEAGRDHRLAELLQRPRDVDALAAGHRPLLDGAMAPPKPEVRHRERLVDRRVERDRNDHLGSVPTFQRAQPRGAVERTTRLAERSMRSGGASTLCDCARNATGDAISGARPA